jgi:next-to-BRCA1 protein 1
MHPECPDYDLCENCEALPISVHPATHPLLKMRHPLTVIPTVYRVGGQTLIPEDLPSATPCCSITTGADQPVQPDNVVEDAQVSSDLEEVVDSTAATDSLETVSVKETPQLTLVKDVPDQHDFSKNADAFTLSPELAAPVSPTASITGRLSLKQMLSEPSQITSEILVEAFQEKVATAAEMLLRPLPSDAPAFGLGLKQEYYAAFISNNNVTDGQVFPAGAEFVKSWRMVNNGNVAWPDTTEVMFVAGDRLSADEHAPSKFPVGRVEPGQEVDVSAGELKVGVAPSIYFCSRDANSDSLVGS